ncbi:ACP S-malonyltransferase [Cellvibrio sp. ARAG 10.3]|uniref:ACP S-malonyltransferase n=1 Tax=Cellvibrio sp. ARAG 10.3 TaxID=3451358 RepID=UPI003F46EC1B
MSQKQSTATRPVVFMLPGQGSQYYQMGRELYEQLPRFRYWMERLDEKVKARAGFSVIAELFRADHGKSKPFTDLKKSHPAIVLVEYALAKTIMEVGITPDFFIGASLGEFSAASLAGAMSLDTLFDLVLHQGEELGAQKTPMGMTSVFLEKSRLLSVIKQYECEIAGEHSASHFVIAGYKDALDKCHQIFRSSDIPFQPLTVNQAFHCSLLDNEKNRVLPFILAQHYTTLSTPLFSCARREKLSVISQDHFWNVIREPIFFRSIIQLVEQEGPCIYLDLGPSSTLTNFAKMNISSDSKSEFYTLMDPFGSDLLRLEKLLTHFGKSTADLLRNTSQGNAPMNAYVFPGQGSQFVGMGKELFADFPDMVAIADDILGYSIESLCTQDKDKKLNQTQYTQPALYVVEALSYLKAVREGEQPDVVAGHSLGEYSALFAAGVFDFATGLKLVKRRGELMSTAKIDGGMAAVLNIDADRIANTLQKGNLHEIDVANFNKPTQTVIAGPKDQLAVAARLFERAGGNFVPLNVSAPFHSRYMQPIQAEFSAYLQQFEFQPPRIPVLSNVTARPHEFNKIKEQLAQQISRSVLWTDTIRYLMSQGDFQYRELGPGDVLTKLISSILQQCEPLQHAVPLANYRESDYSDKPLSPSPSSSIHNMTPDTGRVIGNDHGLANFYQVQSNYVIRPLDYRQHELISELAKSGSLIFAALQHDAAIKDERAIDKISALSKRHPNLGVGVTADIIYPEREAVLIERLLDTDIQHFYIKHYFRISTALTKLRIKTALRKEQRGTLMAEVSSLEEARLFLRSPTKKMIEQLQSSGEITAQEATQALDINLVDAIVYNGDWRELQSLIQLRDNFFKTEISAQQKRPYIGSTGAIGSPVSIARAINCGADFVCAGDIFLCAQESVLDSTVKNLLRHADNSNFIQIPDADLFEFGCKASVINSQPDYIYAATNLYSLWKKESSLETLSDASKAFLETHFFTEGLERAWDNLVEQNRFFSREDITAANDNPRLKMTLLFKHYLKQMQQTLSLPTDELDREIADLNQWFAKNGESPWNGRGAQGMVNHLVETAARMIDQNMKLAS